MTPTEDLAGSDTSPHTTVWWTETAGIASLGWEITGYKQQRAGR